jgi:hypothetical protein
VSCRVVVPPVALLPHVVVLPPVVLIMLPVAVDMPHVALLPLAVVVPPIIAKLAFAYYVCVPPSVK